MRAVDRIFYYAFLIYLLGLSGFFLGLLFKQPIVMWVSVGVVVFSGLAMFASHWWSWSRRTRND